MIQIISFIYEDLDDLYANTYVLIDEEKSAVIIDPAKDYLGLVNYIKKNDLFLKGILITHGHVDHIRGIDVLYDSFKAPIYIGFDDADKFNDTYANCSEFLKENVVVKAPFNTLIDKQVIKLLKEDIIAIHTPYHTSGSMCFYLKDSGVLFTGDFIIPHSVGRSDLPSAQPKLLFASMKKITSLPINTKIYSGHGKSSTLEMELKVNPFVK